MIWDEDGRRYLVGFEPSDTIHVGYVPDATIAALVEVADGLHVR